MRRPTFVSVLAVVALVSAGVIPLFAAPAGATNTCNGAGVVGGQSPITPGAQSAWKIDCTTNALQKVDSITAGDAKDAYWHRGTARTVAITTVAGSQTITYASGAITAADIRRPISGGCLSTGLNVGGVYIMTAGATSGTVSTKQPATGCGATTATIEYTNSRVLRDANCTPRQRTT